MELHLSRVAPEGQCADERTEGERVHGVWDKGGFGTRDDEVQKLMI